MKFETISVIGLGYIGLPTAAVIASRRLRVIGVDVNKIAVDTINQGAIHIVEPELDMLVHAAVTAGYLRATTTPEPADTFVIAVPTPFRTDGGTEKVPDLSYIEAASASIAPVLAPGNLVILESTSPVGATEQMAVWLAAARPDLTFPLTHGEASDIRIAHCPERVLPGQVVRELVQNDRVIGGLTARCSEAAKAFYRLFVEGECISTTARTAELTKLAENSFRDVNIAFANELSIICDKLSIDPWELIALANRHPRVNILQPGPGVGGHCIAVDPWFIVASAPAESRLIRAAREVNDAKPDWAVCKILQTIKSHQDRAMEVQARETVLACYGLAFKPDIDDLRESPAVRIVAELARRHRGPLLVVEPHIDQLPACLTGSRLVSLDYAREHAHVHALLVPHRAFAGRVLPLAEGAEMVQLAQ